MALPVRKYTVGAARFIKGWRFGLYMTDNGELSLSQHEDTHIFFASRLNGGEADCAWGRMMIDAKLPEYARMRVLVFASEEDEALTPDGLRKIDDFLSDNDVSTDVKRQFMLDMGAQSFINSCDMLIYKLEGRYLWFAIEITGAKEGVISKVQVFAPRDSFIEAFPEIYRLNNEFFERYLSIFTSLYMDVQRKIDELWQYVDLDMAPDAMLPILAEWLGISVDGDFLQPYLLRRLLREGYELCRKKGTKQAVSRVAELLSGAKPIVVEQTEFAEMMGGENGKVYEYLYGADPLGFTMLIDREPDEKFYSQLTYMINQFKPIRSTANIVFIKNNGRLDTHCYLDINARLMANVPATLDDISMLSANAVLS